MFKAKAVFGGFSVNNLAKAKEFYTRLGLQLKDETMGLEFDLPGGGSLFVYEKPDHKPATYTMLNLVVDDIDKAVEELKAQGIAFESYDKGMIETDEHNIARGKTAGQGPDIAWFKDPADNILAVLEP